MPKNKRRQDTVVGPLRECVQKKWRQTYLFPGLFLISSKMSGGNGPSARNAASALMFLVKEALSGEI